MKKYELTSEIKVINERTLHRIKALVSFGDVKAGDLGGFIEKEENLSHDGNCWVYDNAEVYQDAQVLQDAKVREKATIYGYAVITENAWISGTARVFMNGKVCEHAEVFQDARVFDNGKVCGCARISGQAQIGGEATVTDFAMVLGNSKIYDNAQVCQESCIYGDSDICCDGEIKTENDLFRASNLGPHHWTATFFKTKTGGISVKDGLFKGSLEDFEQKVKETYGGTTYEKQYEMAIELAKYSLEMDRPAMLIF